jgi:N-acetylglutamate synthase-like GNAT family acetyltransferase
VSFSLRHAQKADAHAIRRLIWQMRLNPTSLDWRRFWVAVDHQDRVIGCGQIKPHSDGSFELASIAVEPDHQRQGVGKALIERLISGYQTTHPGQPLYLTCRPRMEAYYRRYKFDLVKGDELPPYFRRIRRLAGRIKRIFPRMDLPSVMVRKMVER